MASKLEPKNTALAISEPDSELVERLEEAKEALETWDAEEVRLPKIVNKDGFRMCEGAEPILSFTGIIVYTKQSNAYYKKPYKAGSTDMPDCFSADGRNPDSSVEKPINKTCKGCKFNQFGSSTNGDGKACNNTRPTFILVDTEDGEISTMPKVLRISPTSLKAIKDYIFELAATNGSYFKVRTKFEAYKKDQNQAYYNVRCKKVGLLTPQERANVTAVRNLWLGIMREGMFGMDDIETEVKTVNKVQDVSQGEVDF